MNRQNEQYNSEEAYELDEVLEPFEEEEQQWDADGYYQQQAYEQPYQDEYPEAYAEGYEERFEKGEPQKQLSKEFVRQWLIENGFMGKEGQTVPEMTEEYVNSVSERYIELYEHITGEKFTRTESDDINARIEKNISTFLKDRK